MWGASSLNHFSNSKLVEMKTIEALFDDDTVDAVIVRSVGKPRWRSGRTSHPSGRGSMFDPLLKIYSYSFPRRYLNTPV